jgi:hypothetical protein
MIVVAFKTKWFSKAARKAGIADAALQKALAEVSRGQADDLGGGVFKKRLNDNRHRAIILAKAGEFWVYEYLFAKSDRANILDDELQAFRKLARAYGGLTPPQIERLLASGQWKELGDGSKA